MEEKDETMSLDKAFEDITNPLDNTFKFDEEITEGKKEDHKTEETSASPVGTEEETEQKVPYSRFKKKVDEVNEYGSKIKYLEERLEELSQARTKVEDETPEMPPEWVELYGNSEASEKAWKVQVKLDQRREEAAVERMLTMAQRQEEEAQVALAQNEEIIDDSLAELQESKGIKLTQKMEDAILDIVDEFSPVGSDGKYISLFPFDKALEIYELRQGSKVKAVQSARTQVANLANNSNAGDAGDTQVSQRRGWDAWREAL